MKSDSSDPTRLLKKALLQVERWVENHDYKAYEPADALSSHLKSLTFNNLFLERLLIQVFKQIPINLRPLLGVKPHDSTIGRGYMIGGFLALYKLTGEIKYKSRAVDHLNWLMENKSPKYEEYSWGNHYDFASRSGRYGKFEPIIVWTSLIGQNFLNAYEAFGNKAYLQVAESACRWILNLPREETDTGACLSYLATKQSSIHNSNMLGAALLARTAKITQNRKYLEVARAAMQYSCSRQLPNGAWYYGEAGNQHWIDNFHTGYNLDSLKRFIEDTGDYHYLPTLKKGFHFFKEHFIEKDGRPKYYHNRTFPVDSQCASQSIETLTHFSDIDPEALNRAIQVARWTVDHMQDSKGYFYYRQYPVVKDKTPMFHWAQATTYQALALLLSKLEISGDENDNHRR